MYFRYTNTIGGHIVSTHAEERMEERGISSGEIERVLARGCRTHSRGDTRVQCGSTVVVLSNDGVIKTVIRKD